MKKVIVIITIVVALAVGYTIGRYNTIRQAELLYITESEYLIDFGGEVHEYSNDTPKLVDIKEVER